MHRSLPLLPAWAAFSAVAAAQTFTIANSPVVPVPNGNHVDLIIKVDSIKDNSLRTIPLSVTDLSKFNGETIAQTAVATYVAGHAQTGFWLATWQTTGVRPGATETHLLKLELGKFMDVVPFTIHGPAVPEVAMNGPGVPLRLRWSHCAQIRLSSTGVLTHVKTTQSTLVEDKSGQPLPLTKLDLVDLAGGSASAPEGLTLKEQVQPLCVQIAQDFSAAGKFSGNVSLGSREKPDLGTFTLTVYSTARKYQLGGVVCLFLGLVTFFVFAVWAKARSHWILALLPATRLREEASQLLSATESVQQRTGYDFPVLLGPVGNPGSLRDVVHRLSEQKLKEAGLLPWKFASPFPTQDQSVQYQSFLQTTGNQISSIAIIVRWGLSSVLAMWPQVENLDLREAGNTALATLDGLGAFSGPAGLLTTQVQSAINTLRAAIAAAQVRAGGGQPSPTYEVLGSQQLTFQFERLSALVWVAWAVLTLAVGYCALIGFNDGFGTTQDLVQCFLWGVGMPAVGNGFGALSAGSVTSAFSVQIPR